MKKKIGLSIIAVLMIAGAVVFANSNTTKQATNICPDRPGCICSEQTTEQVAKPQVTADNKDICPNKPGCICTK